MDNVEKMPKYMQVGSARGCSIDGCPGRHVARGYCMRHYCRLFLHKRQIESPGDLNPEAREPLREHEFCRMKDCRSQGYSMREAAFDIQKDMQPIYDAWPFETYQQYLKRDRQEEWPEKDYDGDE